MAADEISNFGNVLRGQVVPMMQAAAITGTSMETALKGVYSIIAQYNLSVEDSARVTETLFYASQKTALEFGDLIKSFKMVGPVTAANKVSFEEIVQLLGALGNAGIRGTMAGRALRMLFIQLDAPTMKASKELDKYVVSVLGLNKTWEELVFPEGTFIGMSKYLNLLTELTVNMDDATSWLFST